jgi:hypothetical protein
VHGVWNAPGPRADFRYEYIDQDQPMSGSRRVGVGEIPAHHDEVRTRRLQARRAGRDRHRVALRSVNGVQLTANGSALADLSVQF